MLRQQILKKLAVSFVVLAIFNEIAVFIHWYSIIWWFDMPMHFLGGMAVFYLSAVLWLPARKFVSDRRFLFEGIITALLIGVLWEALELYLFLTYGDPNFILLDSISDLFFDLAGAFLGAYFLAQILNQKSESNLSS